MTITDSLATSAPRPARTRTTTIPLPATWRPTVPAGDPLPLPHGKHTARSLAVTAPLPVIGRVGTRERVRAGDACFGGGEVR